MRPDLRPGTLALLSSGYYDTHWLVQVANGDGTMIDVSHRLTRIAGALPSPDAPIGTLHCEFLREVNDDPASSLAPFIGSDWNVLDDGVTYSALFRVGRRVRACAAITAIGGARPDDAEFYEFFLGRITREGSGGRYGSAWFDANDQGGELQLRKGETAHVYDAGTLIPDVIEQVLTDDGFALTLSTPESLDTVLGTRYEPGKQKTTWEKIQALATSIGRLCWFRYQEAGQAALTLFTPDRNKSGSDFTFPRIMEVDRFDTDEADIFNVLHGEYSDSGGVRREAGPVEDAASIAKYGGIRRVGWIVEDADSVVRTEAVMLEMLGYALSDLSDPDVIATYRVPLFIWGEVSVDRYTFPADDVHYDEAQVLAPFAIRFEHQVGREAYSTIDVRGRPSGGSGAWRTRLGGAAPTTPLEQLKITAVNRVGETGEFEVEFGGAVEEADVHWRIFSLPLPSDHLAQLYAETSLRTILTTSGDSFTATLPNEDQELWYAVIPRATGPREIEVSGDAWEGHVEGGRAPLTFTVEAPENAAGTQATLTVTITEDPRGVVSGVRMWEQRKGVETGPFALAESSGVWTRTFNLLAKPHVVLVRGEVVRSDGQSPIPFGPLTADSDKAANVITALPSYADGTATVRVQFDSDTEVGDDTAGYRLDGGSETLVEVDSDRRASIEVTQSESAEILLEVRGYNAAGTAGDWFPVTIQKHVDVPTASPRLLSVSVAQQSPGNCGLGAPLVNRVTASFVDAPAGCTWDLVRYEDGVSAAVVGTGTAVGTTTIDDEIDDEIDNALGARIDCSYQVFLYDTDSAVSDVKMTNTLVQLRSACP